MVLWAGLSVGEGLDDEDRCCFHPKDEGLDNVWCCLTTTGELGGSDKCCCCFHPRWAGLLADIAKRTLSSVDVGERVIFSGGVGVTVEVCRRGGLGDVATGGQSGSWQKMYKLTITRSREPQTAYTCTNSFRAWGPNAILGVQYYVHVQYGVLMLKAFSKKCKYYSYWEHYIMYMYMCSMSV